jgi:SAM-dependent methyltransferase
MDGNIPPSSPDLDVIQVETTELDDYRWLASDDAQPYLARALNDARSTVALVRSLRKELSPSRTHLVVSQIELRDRARQKFAAADKMLFTRKLLEQATDERSARYKASRFPADAETVDLCCGLGGDLLALADHGQSLGIDIDPVSALLANANCQRLGRTTGSAQVGDARQPALEAGVLWHIDPDRRAQGTRSIQAEFWEPNADALRHLIAQYPDGAVKLAPASDLPEDFPAETEREWIGQPRSCRQQIAWLGNLSRHHSMHTATVLARSDCDTPISITGNPNQEVSVAGKLGNFVHEPHAAVLAARLTGALAEILELQTIVSGVAYLTSDQPIEDDARLTTFEVVAVMPFDIKQVKAALRQRKMGRLEIKHRGLQLDPELLQKRFKVPGDNRGCLIIVGGHENTRAIITKRRAGG